MNARIPPKNRLTNEPKKSIKEFGKAYVQKHLANEQNKAMNRFFKLSCYVLNRTFGFGTKRLECFIGSVNQIVKECDTDEVFWEHLDKVVIDELKLGDYFYREGENGLAE